MGYYSLFFGVYNSGLSTVENDIRIVGETSALSASVGALYLSDKDAHLILDNGIKDAMMLHYLSKNLN